MLLPGITALIRLVSKVREAAAQTDPALPGRLLASLRVPAGVRFSEMESWRRPPTRVSGPGLVRALDRAADLAGLGVRAVDCSGVPPNRVAALARFGPPRPDARFAPGAALSRRRGQRPRTVPLPVDARTQLRRWLSEREQHPAGRPGEPALWLGRRGRLSPRQLQRVVTALGAGAGLEVSPHTLRHTAATRWLRAGVDVVVVAGLVEAGAVDYLRPLTVGGRHTNRGRRALC